VPGRGPAVSASKLVFCDLAACEPVRSGAASGRGGGKAAADAAHVSKSLLALGNVISAASNPRRNNGHVPYRDSLLTRVLQVCALGQHVPQRKGMFAFELVGKVNRRGPVSAN